MPAYIKANNAAHGRSLDSALQAACCNAVGPTFVAALDTTI